MEYSIQPDSARKPLVHSANQSDDSDTDWQEGVPEGSDSDRGFFSNIVNPFRKKTKHVSSRGIHSLRIFSQVSGFFPRKIRKMHIYVLFLSLLLLGTVVCFGIHITHHKHKLSPKKAGISQTSHGHRFIKGQCQKSRSDEEESPALVILQANDIYELGPYIYATGKSSATTEALAETGGLSKFLALKKAYQSIYGEDKVMAALSGDYLSPSAMSTARILEHDIRSLRDKHNEENGKGNFDFAERSPDKNQEGSLAGVHMISVGNKVFDIATFGNHEFDLSKRDLKKRVDESRFPWITSNIAFQRNFTKNIFNYRIKETTVPSLSDDDKVTEKRIRFAFISATMNNFPVPRYVRIMNSTETKIELIRLTRFLRTEKQVDFVILLTHQPLSADISLIKAFSEDEGLNCDGINLVLGGHEHESSYGVIGTCAVPLTKSFYNAKAVYVHKIYRDEIARQAPSFHVDSAFVSLDNDCPEDPILNQEIEEWWNLAADAFLKDDLDLQKSVAYLAKRYDLRNDLIYSARNSLLTHIADALVYCGGSRSIDGAIFNTGAIRVDNFIGPGVFSVYDVVRVWPYEDQIKLIRIKGSTLRQIIETSNLMNRGTHGFIQLSSEFSDGCMSIEKPSTFEDLCTLSGKAIEKDSAYVIALPGYLLEGKQENFEFLQNFESEGEESTKLVEVDVRHCLTSYLPIHFPLPS